MASAARAAALRSAAEADAAEQARQHVACSTARAGMSLAAPTPRSRGLSLGLEEFTEAHNLRLECVLLARTESPRQVTVCQHEAAVTWTV